MNNCNLRMRRYFIFQYKSVKMLLLKLGSQLPNLVKILQSVLKIWTKCRLNFHEVEYHQHFRQFARKQNVARYHLEKISNSPALRKHSLLNKPIDTLLIFK